MNRRINVSYKVTKQAQTSVVGKFAKSKITQPRNKNSTIPSVYQRLKSTSSCDRRHHIISTNPYSRKQKSAIEIGKPNNNGDGITQKQQRRKTNPAKNDNYPDGRRKQQAPPAGKSLVAKAKASAGVTPYVNPGEAIFGNRSAERGDSAKKAMMIGKELEVPRKSLYCTRRN